MCCVYSQCDLVAAPEPSEELLEPAVGVEGLTLARVEHHHLLLTPQQHTCMGTKGMSKEKRLSVSHTEQRADPHTPPLSVSTYTYVG